PAARMPQRRGHGPGGFGMALPGEKAMDFRGSGRRLLGMLRPERVVLGVVVLLSVVSVVLAVIGPKLLGTATDVIFSGLLGRGLPEGTTTAEAAAQLRARGDDVLADILER